MLASFWRLLFGPEPRATSEEAAVPIISQQEALAIAKSLAVRSGHFWDDETARVWWCKSPPPVPSWAVTAGHEPKPTAPCWAVMTGQEPKHWLDRYTDDGLTLLIDAQTGVHWDRHWPVRCAGVLRGQTVRAARIARFWMMNVQRDRSERSVGRSQPIEGLLEIMKHRRAPGICGHRSADQTRPAGDC
jgi:hypothetical protein